LFCRRARRSAVAAPGAVSSARTRSSLLLDQLAVERAVGALGVLLVGGLLGFGAAEAAPVGVGLALALAPGPVLAGASQVDYLGHRSSRLWNNSRSLCRAGRRYATLGMTPGTGAGDGQFASQESADRQR